MERLMKKFSRKKKLEILTGNVQKDKKLINSINQLTINIIYKGLLDSRITIRTVANGFEPRHPCSTEYPPADSLGCHSVMPGILGLSEERKISPVRHPVLFHCENSSSQLGFLPFRWLYPSPSSASSCIWINSRNPKTSTKVHQEWKISFPSWNVNKNKWRPLNARIKGKPRPFFASSSRRKIWRGTVWRLLNSAQPI